MALGGDPAEGLPHLCSPAAADRKIPGLQIPAKPVPDLRLLPAVLPRAVREDQGCHPAGRLDRRGRHVGGTGHQHDLWRIPGAPAGPRHALFPGGAGRQLRDLMAARHLWLHGGAASDLEELRHQVPGHPEDLLELQRRRAVPLPLLHLAGHGWQRDRFLSAHQLHLHHQPQAAHRRMGEPGAEGRPGQVPAALRLRRRGRRSQPGLH